MAAPVYMDVHVPAAISEGLRHLGHDVLTAQADDAARLSDEELLFRATELGRVLFTQDDDFLRLVARNQLRGVDFSGVLYAHQLSAGIGPLVSDLDLVLSACDAEELAGRVTYLPLR